MHNFVKNPIKALKIKQNVIRYKYKLLRRDQTLKGKDYRLRKILYQLRSLQEKKVRSVQWKLKQEQLEFLSEYFEIRPVLYIVNTRRFRNIYNIKNSLIKRIHNANKSGKSQMVCKFSNEELKTLQQFQIPYKPFKYTIYLSD